MKTLVIAVRNLWANRARTLILGAAIAGVTTLLVVLLSLTAGVRKTILESSMALVSGHVNIAGFYKISQTSAAPMVTQFQKLREMAEKEVPEARLIIDRVKAYGTIISESGGRVQIPIWGIDMKQESEILGPLTVTEGKVEDLGRSGTLAIFDTQAKKLGVHVGDSVTVSMPTTRNVSNTIDVRVVAIFQDMGLFSNFSSYMNADDVRQIYQIQSSTTGQIMLYLPGERFTTEVENRLRGAIAKAGYAMMEKDSNPFWLKFEKVVSESWKGQRIDVTTWEDETSFMKWILNIFNALTFVMTSILLFIVALGLTNTLWISVRERTGEIGTLRAIGMQRKEVVRLFLLEAFVLSAWSVAAGLLIGGGLVLTLNAIKIPITGEAFQLFLMSKSLQFSLEPMALLMIFVVITFCLMMGAWLPSRRAGKLNPINAIQTVE